MDIQIFDDFYDAQEAAEEQGLSVGGTYKGSKAQYFLHDPAASDEELRDLSFEVQNGRPMSNDERRLLELAVGHHPESFQVSPDQVWGLR